METDPNQNKKIEEIPTQLSIEEEKRQFATQMPPLYFKERTIEQKVVDLSRAKELLTGSFAMFAELERGLGVEFGVTETGEIYIPDEQHREKAIREHFGRGSLWHKSIVSTGQYDQPKKYERDTQEPRRIYDILDLIVKNGVNPKELGPEATILDIGCGTGPLANVLGKEVKARIVGVDINPHMVRHSRDVAAQEGRTNNFYIEGDGPKVLENGGDDTTKIEDNSATIINASLSAQWPDQRRLFTQIEKKLADDGLAVIAVGAEGNQDEYSRCRDKVLREMNEERIKKGKTVNPFLPRVLDMYDRQYMYQELEKLGLEVVNKGSEVQTDYRATTAYNTGEKVTKFLDMVAGDKNLFHGWDEEEIQEAKERIKKEYDQMITDGVGPTNRIAYIVLRKIRTDH